MYPRCPKTSFSINHQGTIIKLRIIKCRVKANKLLISALNSSILMCKKVCKRLQNGMEAKTKPVQNVKQVKLIGALFIDKHFDNSPLLVNNREGLLVNTKRKKKAQQKHKLVTTYQSEHRRWE